MPFFRVRINNDNFNKVCNFRHYMIANYSIKSDCYKFDTTKVKPWISDIDTERFGFPVARIECFSSAPEDIVRALRAYGVKLVIGRVDGGHIDLANKLERLGFELKDIQVTYKSNLKDLLDPSGTFPPGVCFRDASSEDQKDIVSISNKAFINYGHYAADRRLNPKKCLEIYRDWALRCLKDPDVSDKMLVARIDNKTAGFLSFKIFKKDCCFAARGVIGAVSPEFRNGNIFCSLILLGNIWAKKSGLEWMEHNALLTNYPVNQALTKAGLKIQRSFSTFHLWLDRP